MDFAIPNDVEAVVTVIGVQEAGVVSISNLARQFALAGDLVQSIITARIGTLVQGRLESGLIFTPAYIARIKAQVLLPEQRVLSVPCMHPNLACQFRHSVQCTALQKGRQATCLTQAVQKRA